MLAYPQACSRDMFSINLVNDRLRLMKSQQIRRSKLSTVAILQKPCTTSFVKGSLFFTIECPRGDTHISHYIVISVNSFHYCRYAPVDELLARQLWEEAYSESNLFHGFGNRLKKLHLVSGMVLPIWPEIESVLSSQIRQADRRLNVMRLETTGDLL